MRTGALLGFGIAVTTLWASAAQAQTLRCSDQLGAPPIYISGSSALEPLIRALGKVMGNSTDAAKKYALVYVNDGSCEGVRKFIAFGGGPKTTIPNTATPFYIDGAYDGTSAPPKCLLTDQPAAGVTVDLGLSDVFAEVCTGAAKPSDVTDVNGPAAAMLFVTHPNSTETAITAEEAYLALGLGAMGEATPWTDPMYFFIRPNSSGTKNLLAAAIGVPVAKWQGIFMEAGKNFGSADVRDKVAAQAANANKALGILGADFLDAGNTRQQVKALAFRGYKQKKAFWPDSSPTSFDKKNVRDGHYTAWGYVHMIANIDGAGAVTNAKAKLVMDLINGTDSIPGIDSIRTVAQTAHLIPQCAMKVKRGTEGGDLSLYSSPTPCGCYFDSLVTPGPVPAGCTACSATAPCATGMCRNGFCEAK